MSENPFDRPSAGGGETFEPAQFMGALCIVYPKSYNPNDTTKHGQTTSADVDIVVVDRVDPATNQPVIKRNARLFGNLANSVRDSLGRQVLGRIGQVPTNKGNPAWALLDPTDADAAQAGPVHQAYQAGQFKPPAQPQQPQGGPAQGQQWGAPPAQPQQQWGAPPQQQWQQPQPPAQGPPQGQPDLWAGQQQYAQQPPAQAPRGAPPAGPEDPSIAALIAKGLPEAQVRAMDPQTRASVLATYGG